MRNVYIFTALWTLDTFIPRRGVNATYALGDLTVDERYQLLARVAEHAWAHLAREMLNNLDVIFRQNAAWMFLFVAPEYYFSRSGTEHQISEAEKRLVVSRLAALSGHYTNLILVPGSIAWKKPVDRPLSEIRKKAKNGSRTGPPKAKTRLEKFEAQAKRSYINEAALIDHAIDREIKEILDDPHQKLSEKKRVASSEYRGERRHALLKQAKDKYEHATETMKKNVESDLARCYVARNTAYAFYGGSEVARYHKRNNFYEVRGDESDEGFVIFEPGGGPDGKGDLFTIDGVTFGIEVCYDHTVGHMSQLTANRPNVQIVMSAAVKIVNEHVTVPKDGYLVHASSEADGTAAYWNSGKKISEIQMTEQQAERGLLRYAILRFEMEEPLTIEEWISNNK
ncbi:MAG: hypothetical protein JOZ54_01645 [Acidobacteria bacterium]|nr:hypothetical protein [Acidobacteriota bacterium]